MFVPKGKGGKASGLQKQYKVEFANDQTNLTMQSEPFAKLTNSQKRQFGGGQVHCGGALGSHWQSQITAHSRLIVNDDPSNMSHLSIDQRQQIQTLQRELEDLQAKKPKKPISAKDIFKNKNFNAFKAKFPHQSAQELQELIQSKWDNMLTDEERKQFE